MTIPAAHSVLILGATVTGLTAAYYLGQQGYRVTIIDHVGWRKGEPAHHLDDDVPLLLGCHQETRRLLREIDEWRLSSTDPLIPLEFRLANGRLAGYPASRLPGPWHWIVNLFRFNGLAWKERWRLFSHIEHMWEQAESPSLLENRIADEWLASLGQSDTTRRDIWNPLALWLTGNAVTRLSAAVFMGLLQTVFLRQASHARLTGLEGTWENRLITPLRSRVMHLGVTIQSRSILPHLRAGQTSVNGIHVAGDTLFADWYIAALPHSELVALLPERLLTRFAYFAQIADLVDLSHVTVEMTCRSAASRPRLLFLSEREQPFHQLTSQAVGLHTVRLRLSSIDDQSLAALPDNQIIAAARTAVPILLPDMGVGEIQSIKVHRDNQGLALPPGATMLRPLQQSPLSNFLVAGGWTDTGWPANLESALVSAHRCACAIAVERSVRGQKWSKT